jgi:hypothetical protein
MSAPVRVRVRITLGQEDAMQEARDAMERLTLEQATEVYEAFKKKCEDAPPPPRPRYGDYEDKRLYERELDSWNRRYKSGYLEKQRDRSRRALAKKLGKEEYSPPWNMDKEWVEAREKWIAEQQALGETKATRKSLIIMFARSVQGSEFKRKIMERHARKGDERNMHGRDRTDIAGSMIDPINEWWWEESDETDDEAVQAGAKGD